MSTASNIKFTINFNDPELDDEDRDHEVQKLLNQLKDLDTVEVQKPVDPNPPEGNKAIGGVLIGLLTAEVSMENVKHLMGFLGDRLSRKTIELKVEADGRKLEVSASSKAELDAALNAAKEFLAAA